MGKFYIKRHKAAEERSYLLIKREKFFGNSGNFCKIPARISMNSGILQINSLILRTSARKSNAGHLLIFQYQQIINWRWNLSQKADEERWSIQLNRNSNKILLQILIKSAFHWVENFDCDERISTSSWKSE